MVKAQTTRDPFKLLDALCNEPIRVSESVAALASLIFLRWVDFQEAEAEAMASFDDSEYLPVLPAALHWRRWCDLPPHELKSLFAQFLPSGIERIGNAGEPWAASLLRILPVIHSLSKLTPRAISHLVDWLVAQPFETPSDRQRLLVLFDHFLDQANAQEFGQFRTPSDIVELMVSLAGPSNGQRIYDPCCGSGGFLSAAWETAQKVGKEKFSRPVGDSLEVAGVENNLSAFVIALARLVLAGVSRPQLELGNSLEREGFGNPTKEGFDLVISNPPWGLKIEPYGIHHFPVPTKDGTSLFVQHAVSQLRPSGRALLVVPQGFLFQQGKVANVRQWLMERHRVEAVIGLPEGAFQPYTAIKAAILIIQRDAGPTQSVRMVDGTAFFDPRKGKDPAWIASHQIAALRNALVQDADSKAAWDVPASTLAELDYDLSPVRRGVSGLEQALESLDIPILPLKELCDVTAGRSAKSVELSDVPVGENPVPFIRTGDLKRGQTMKNTSWLNEEVAANFGPRHRLRAGDVLVSKAGTVGKAGIVRNGAVGGIASGTLFVLTHLSKQLDPHFLTAFLMSKDCQEWLQSRSSGSVISGLRKQFVEELRVPVPPLPIQERVAADVRNYQVDALTQLIQLLTQDEDDLLANWIDRSLKSLSTDTGRTDEDPSFSVRFQIFGEDFKDVRVWTISDEEPPALMKWALSLVSLRELFQGSDDVPQGPALLSMLQSGVNDLKISEGQIDGHTPLEGKARDLTKACIKRLESAIDGLLSSVRVTISPQTSSLNAGISQDVPFLVKNEGPLPLRNFTIDAADWVFGGDTVFFPERSERVMTMRVEAPEKIGRHVIKGEWFGKTMDSRQVQGEQEFVFEILAQNETAEESFDLGTSPYFISEPVGQSRRDIFIGREEVLRRIKIQLESGNTVLLEGNRRAGKSSILKQIEGFDKIPGKLAVYSSMQATEGDERAAGMRSESVWRTLANSIASGLTAIGCDVPLPDGSFLPGGKGVGIARACRKGISADAPWEEFLEYVGVATRLLADRNLALVLMVDEFDKLQEGIDNGITSPQIPENIRYLIQNLPGFSAILTGSRRMQRLRHEYWSALYGLGARIGVTALGPEDARRLVLHPVEGRLRYSEEAISLLIDLSARQPFLIQSLANLVFELVSTRGSRSVTAAIVEESASRFVQDNEHFASLMDYAESDQRRFLTILVHQAGKDPDPVTFGTLQERLLGQGIEISDETLDKDLQFLRDLELIDYHGDGAGTYSLTVPLMGRWLDFQHDYRALLAKARAEQDNQL